MISLALILPAAHRSTGNGIAVALGHDEAPGNTYSVPLSATGAEPATHYGARTWASPGFVLMIEIASTGAVPDGTSPELAAMALGIRAQHPDAMAALIADARETDQPAAHWDDVLAGHGLASMSAQMAP